MPPAPLLTLDCQGSKQDRPATGPFTEWPPEQYADGKGGHVGAQRQVDQSVTGRKSAGHLRHGGQIEIDRQRWKGSEDNQQKQSPFAAEYGLVDFHGKVFSGLPVVLNNRVPTADSVYGGSSDFTKPCPQNRHQIHPSAARGSI